ncbi:CLUMA_CG004086, isoform A [Clunio marinus]|uniref:CLUMA_CG004086, isoform A n=1 Tax=Clunio marinus TaxID=568069 RepID=A0A1J1HQG5_9DIPT|nr:CLUMA_CG004086, isoform A [Clunio marinus]
MEIKGNVYVTLLITEKVEKGNFVWQVPEILKLIARYEKVYVNQNISHSVNECRQDNEYSRFYFMEIFALVSPKERQFCTAIKIKIHHAALQNKQKETFSQQDKHRQI